MRIISGKLKGRKLRTPPPDELSIRPTSDRAREALFSIIGERVKGARVLDLFAGTGAFGLEAYSRGAGFVVFVENAAPALRLLKKNITLLFDNSLLDGEIRLVAENLARPLSFRKLPPECHSGFDIIFADPPYGQDLSFSTLDFINNSGLLRKNGLLIVEERNTVALPEELADMVQTDRRLYGETAFSFYRRTTS